ncbi:type II secretion system F family protein [Hoeflea sp. TYP-13]|uniref:type II secretion system F family protein n=1 Tax=Hoeflea sp. TYP-13 TaxID=3230023 RepID=UPI0034C5F97D
MPRFRYKAYLSNGKIDGDTIEAGSKEAAFHALSQSGKMPFLLELDKRRENTRAKMSGGKLLSSLSKPSDARLFTELSVLLQSGFNIDQAITTSLSDDINAADKVRLETIKEKLNEGQSVAASFAQAGVSKDVVALISAGENSGNLPTVFSGMSTRFEQEAKRRSEMQEALLYPVFLIVMMIAAIFVLAFYLVPAIEPIFDGQTQDTPLIVSALSTFRQVVTNYGVWILSILLVAVGAVTFSPQIRQRVLNLRRLLPFVGAFVTETAVASYLHALHMLFSNGVPIKDAMQLAIGSASSGEIERQLLTAENEVSSGSSLHAALAQTGLMNDGLIAQIRIGEESNNLPMMLARAAAAIEARQKVKLDRLFKFLTPAITIFLGLVIGGLVTSVMSTLLSINELAIR